MENREKRTETEQEKTHVAIRKILGTVGLAVITM
jgi:hypothetical protein